MKTITTLIAMALLLSAPVAYAQAPQVKLGEGTAAYQHLLMQVLSKAKQNKGLEDVYNSVNELKRLGKMYPAEWLPDYYAALFEMKLALAGKPEKKDDLLADAQERIATLKKNTGANASEVYTLSGYYYYVMIAGNPEENGQKYYKDVLSEYQKAINLDGKNPRPQLLQAIFNNNMSEFLKKRDDGFCNKLKEIATMFDAFVPKSEVDPSWGMQELKSVSQPCN